MVDSSLRGLINDGGQHLAWGDNGRTRRNSFKLKRNLDYISGRIFFFFSEYSEVLELII